jgi:putative membrane protein
MWFMHDGWSWGWMAFGAAWMVFFWGAIIVLVAWAISRLTTDRERIGGQTSGGRSALDIAKERYACGEITREQFEQFREDLR